MFSLLSPDFLPRWSTFTADQIEPSIRQALGEAKEAISQIASQAHGQASYESSFMAFENAAQTLSRAWGRINHLDSTNDYPAQREAIHLLLPEVSEFYSSIYLNSELYAVFKAVAEGKGACLPSDHAIVQRHIQETLADFKNSGADLPEDQKVLIADIDSELSIITKKYSEHVLDATNAWELVVTDEKVLAGLPESAIASAAANAASKGIPAPAWRFTLQGPSMMPILQHAKDGELRKKVWFASVSLGSEAPFDNVELVWKILNLRQQKAKILGHQNFADSTLQRRMARDGQTALDFIEGIHQRIKAPFLEENRKLSEYKALQTDTVVEPLEPWDYSYWAEIRRKQHYAIDDEDLRPYFPVDRVMAGLFEISSKLFGITITQKPSVYFELGKGLTQLLEGQVETWHPEVSFYEIHDSKSHAHLGSFYADWHPRESKRGGAWMNSLHTGGLGEPHLGLIIGNMSPPVGNSPALLTHREVETIFHEFGHLLHGLLSEVPIKSLAGTNVAWDFVELPSQIMENFCWERETLDLFARHHITGEPIPKELFDKMLAAKNYMSATAFMRQLSLGKLDLELHFHTDHYLGRDLTEVDREILAEYRAPIKTLSPSIALRLNHLFSSPVGYAAGYYSYKWAEVLDADAFTRFQKEGVLNSETGLSFREHILSKGNSLAPEVLYEAFMSRPADPMPLLTRAGLA